jgi:hypothetical protein
MEICGGQYSIKQIFLHGGNWESFRDKYASLIRPAVIDNVNKILSCKTEKLGFHQYVCQTCGYSKKVPHTCKSRFCSSCGKIAVDNWVQNSISQFPDIQYRHIVFTLPEQLWILCLFNRKILLNSMFKLAAQSILSWAKTEKNAVPGIITVLHTFGKSLDFKPHIHMIVSCGGISSDHSKWIEFSIFPEKVLKARWKYNVISFIRSSFKDNLIILAKPLDTLKSYSAFNSFLNMLYQRYIWYVHIGRKPLSSSPLNMSVVTPNAQSWLKQGSLLLTAAPSPSGSMIKTSIKKFLLPSQLTTSLSASSAISRTDILNRSVILDSSPTGSNPNYVLSSFLCLIKISSRLLISFPGGSA